MPVLISEPLKTCTIQEQCKLWIKSSPFIHTVSQNRLLTALMCCAHRNICCCWLLYVFIWSLDGLIVWLNLYSQHATWGKHIVSFNKSLIWLGWENSDFTSAAIRAMTNVTSTILLMLWVLNQKEAVTLFFFSSHQLLKIGYFSTALSAMFYCNLSSSWP